MTDESKPDEAEAKPEEADAKPDEADAKPDAEPEPPAEAAAPAPTPVAEAAPPAAAQPAETSTRVVGGILLALALIVLGLLGPEVFGRGLREGVENSRLRLVIQLVALALPGYPAALGTMALFTGRRPPERFNPLGIPFEAWWYDLLAILSWREIRAVFTRPVAYIVLFVFLAINGLLFFALLQYYAGPISLTQDFELPPNYWLTNNGTIFFSIMLICPAITMRLLAEEQDLGTLESLLTAPVTHIQVVLSKFASAVFFYSCMLFVTLGYLVILRQFANEWDWGPVLGGYLGLFLIGCLYLSIGLFTSSITRSQVIAFVIALPLIVGPFFLNMLEPGLEKEWMREVIRHVTPYGLHQDLNRGIIHWKTLVFFVSNTLFFLFLAVRGVESHRWR